MSIKSPSIASLVDCFVELVRKWYFAVPLLLVAVGAYGGFLTNYAISVDDMVSYNYTHGTEVHLGRLTWTFLAALLNIRGGGPWFSDFCGIVLVVFGAVCLAALFRWISEKKISISACMIFACLISAYPMYSDMFCYPDCAFRIGSIMVLTVVSIVAFRLASKGGGWKKYLFGLFVLTAICSWYEIGIMFFALTVFLCCIVRFRFVGAEGETTGAWFKRMILFYLVPLILGTLIAKGAAFAILAILNTSILGIDSTEIQWGMKSTTDVLSSLAGDVFFQYVIKGIWYLPIAAFVFSCIVSTVGFLGAIVKAPGLRIRYILCAVGVLLCLSALSIFQGSVSLYRTMAILLALFCSFTALLTYQFVADRATRKSVRATVLACMMLTAFWQVSDISHWFSIEQQRSDEEKATVEDIGLYVEQNYGSNKPVIMTGAYSVPQFLADQEWVQPDDLKLKMLKSVYGDKRLNADKKANCFKIQQSNMNSTLKWSMAGELSSGSLRYIAMQNYFSLCGYDFPDATDDQLDAAREKVSTSKMPVWPSKKSVVDAGDYVVVHLG